MTIIHQNNVMSRYHAIFVQQQQLQQQQLQQQPKIPYIDGILCHFFL